MTRGIRICYTGKGSLTSYVQDCGSRNVGHESNLSGDCVCLLNYTKRLLCRIY